MLANIEKVMPLLTAHYDDIIVYGFIMVSAIIVAIGLLKPILFDKIQNKHIRKAALAFSTIAACYLTVLVYFLVAGYGLKYYSESAAALTVACIITYWLYENTCLRNLINLIGGIALRKVLVVLTADDIKAVKTELVKTGAELKATAKQELKKITTTKSKDDKDLKNL